MNIKIFWITSVMGYVIQTRCLSSIHSFNNKQNEADNTNNSITVYLTFIYFATWLLVFPLSKFLPDYTLKRHILPVSNNEIVEENSHVDDNQDPLSLITTNQDIIEAHRDESNDVDAESGVDVNFDFDIQEEGDEINESPIKGSSSAEQTTSNNSDINNNNDEINDNINNNNEVDAENCTNKNDMITQANIKDNDTSLTANDNMLANTISNPRSRPRRSQRNRHRMQNASKNYNWTKTKYFLKLLLLSILVLIPIFAFLLALSIAPAFDISLIQNTSIFEITILLYGICGLARRKNVFRNYIVMMIALVGILLVSYTKATCDLLAGKLSINQETGELNDPFLFDRLKGTLLCGLASLPIGPFAVLYNRWFNNSKNTLAKQGRHLSWIGLINMCILLPFFPKLSSTTSLLYSGKSFWLPISISIVFGAAPYLLSLLLLNRNTVPEYATTTNLGAIIVMGLSEWISEPNQTYIVRWEVIGYLALAVCCIFLSVSFFGTRHFR